VPEAGGQRHTPLVAMRYNFTRVNPKGKAVIKAKAVKVSAFLHQNIIKFVFDFSFHIHSHTLSF